MTRSEAYRYLRDKADRALNAERVPDQVRTWAEEVHDMLFVFDEAPAENVVAAIYEYGYVMGMEMILHKSCLEPFLKGSSIAMSAAAWSVVKEDFITRCKEQNYGIE